LDCVSIHPVTTKIQTSFLTQLLKRKENAQVFDHEANGDFKTVTVDKTDDGSTTLQLLHNTKLIDRVKGRKPVQKKIFQNMHPVCNKALK
jgi:hypothetical protein